MIIKGIELLQMIADKKIKDETIINRIDDEGIFKYIFKNGKLYYKDTIDTITSFFKIREILNQNFEIVENKEETKKIEEIKEFYNYLENDSDNKILLKHIKRINELLNKAIEILERGTK